MALGYIVSLFKIRMLHLIFAGQRAIVAKIEAEQALIAAKRERILRFEKNIQTTLARISDENDKAAEDAI
jgi:type I restriction enzyme M protein